MKKSFLNSALIFMTVLCCVFFLSTVLYVFIQIQPVSKNPEGKRFEVPSGTSVHSVSKKLKDENLIKNQRIFYYAARYPFFKLLITGDNSAFVLKSGVYKISENMTICQIFSILSSGQQEYIRVSFPEGLTISKIGLRLEESGVCSLSDFKEAVTDKDLLNRFGIKADNFEGFLFPDTYFFNPSMEGKDVVVQMVENFFNNIKKIEGYSELSDDKLLYYVTLASIIEREYRIDAEAPLIASVFKNRLAKNIGLYSCATIEYIITEIQNRPHPDVITYADLAIDSPYNTYKWAGLTPGPISNPGEVALNAALNSAKTNYYFFRLVDANAGRHVFTKDFSTHISEGYISNTKKNGR